MEELEKTIYFTNCDDLAKLRVLVRFDTVDYSPSTKTTLVNVRASLIFPNTVYGYGPGLRMSGDAVKAKTISITCKDTREMNFLVQQMNDNAQSELEEVKKEIERILESGVSRVSISMTETLERIMQKIKPKGQQC